MCPNIWLTQGWNPGFMVLGKHFIEPHPQTGNISKPFFSFSAGDGAQHCMHLRVRHKCFSLSYSPSSSSSNLRDHMHLSKTFVVSLGTRGLPS